MNRFGVTDMMNVAIFSALTILLSFAVYLLPLPREMLPFVSALIPALMAIILTALSDGTRGVRALWGKLGQWRISSKWLAFALFLALEMRLLMSVVAWLLGLSPTIQVRPASPSQLPMFALLLIIAAMLEELGWRGYLLPKLLTQHSALVASVAIGLAWGSLHLALHLPGMIHAGLPLLPTLLGVCALSVILTWFYIQSGGSIVLTTIFHAAQSFFVIVNEGIILEAQIWLMAGVYLVVATLVVIGAGWKRTRSATSMPTIHALPAGLD